MRKLELKYIFNYLFYELKLIDLLTKEFYILTIDDNMVSDEISVFDFIENDNFKPILHPLSDLTKEIEVNGEIFVPLIELTKPFCPGVFKSSLRILSMDRSNYYEIGCKDYVHKFNKNIDRVEYSDIQKLLEWHFDIYGLIEKNLAIDINVLNELN